MEGKDTVLLIAVAGLAVYMLTRKSKTPEFFPPYTPQESVTSKIAFGIPGEVAPDSQRYPGYEFNPDTGDYVDMATGEHLMID